MEQNSGRPHNTTGMATGATHNLELHVEELQSIFSFCATCLYNRGNSKVEYTYGWYSASAGINDMQRGNNKVKLTTCDKQKCTYA
jgi:hypothetical protein